MKKICNYVAGIVLLLCLMGLACSCGNESDVMTEEEAAAAEEILGSDVVYASITKEVLTKEAAVENDSVEKVFETDDGDYVFVCSPIGYSGPIHILVAIDGATNKTLGMRIVSHMESKGYVKDMETPWFTDRFLNKNALQYLERVKREVTAENQIMVVSGSTVTTDGIIDGVNDAFGVYRTIENPYYKGVPGQVLLKGSDGTELGTLCAEDLKDLDSYRRKMVIHTSQGDEPHDYRGVRLSEAISLIDPSLLSGAGNVEIVGTDAYSAQVSLEEIRMENNAYLMYEDQDKPIKSISGEDGALRLVLLADDFGQRFTSDVLELRFQ